jgi:hypothetical protein
MRILLTEADAADSVALERDALRRGHDVVRCQPRDAAALPCVGASDVALCPLSRHVDVLVDVRADGEASLQIGEFGMICGLRERVPIVVVGDNPLGPAATQSAESDALDVAVRLARRTDGRPAIEVVRRDVAQAMARTGTRTRLTWIGYLDRDEGFDVIVETDAALQLPAYEEVERTLHALLWQAHDEYRFGRIIFEHR